MGHTYLETPFGVAGELDRQGRRNQEMRRWRTPTAMWLTALGAVMLIAAVMMHGAGASGRVGLFVAGAGLLGCGLWGVPTPDDQPEG